MAERRAGWLLASPNVAASAETVVSPNTMPAWAGLSAGRAGAGGSRATGGVPRRARDHPRGTPARTSAHCIGP